MGVKITGWSSSLRQSFTVYIIVAVVLAFAGSALIGVVSNYAQSKFATAYSHSINNEQSNQPHDPQGTQLYDEEGNPVIIIIQTSAYVWDMPWQQTVMNLISGAQFILIPIWVLLCIGAVVNHFYKNRLKKPLHVLMDASANIANHNLDFQLSYDAKDELGQLCTSFETMRSSLQENNQLMWRQMEERKRLNAAFSHDLRTPLTVLKGHTHMLQRYLPEHKLGQEQIVSTLDTMASHIQRLENYVTAMNHLQKLEDITIKRVTIDRASFTEGFKETCSMLAGSKTLVFSDNCSSDTLTIDPEIVMQVCENLIANAIRFAATTISVSCSISDAALRITVTDDGPGFSREDLENATNPFYRAQDQVYDTHFGLGLHICKILCERHGGTIMVQNIESGSATVSATFA